MNDPKNTLLFQLLKRGKDTPPYYLSITHHTPPPPVASTSTTSSHHPPNAPIPIPQPQTLVPNLPKSMSTGDDQPSNAVTPALALPPRKASPGMPWGQAETFHLIDAYEEKWLELKRSQLKAPEWEEVASVVAERAGTGGAGQFPAKSGTQCRHKIEKLRKRFKAERVRPVRSFWPFFNRMERLNRGPAPISAFPPTRHVANSARSSDEEDDRDNVSNSRSLNGILHSGSVAKEEEMEEEKDVGRDGTGSGGGGLVVMIDAIKGFGEEISRIEKRKMDILREIEKDRMEMEMKRQKMVMEAQQYLMERIADAVSGSVKKAKKLRNPYQ